MRRGCLFLLLITAGMPPGSSTAPARAENWPGWRKDGSGVSSETDLPTRWGPETNIRWKTPIAGDAASSPIVWGDQVLLTTARQARQPHGLATAGLVAITLLCLVAMACLVDGTFHDPLGRLPAVWSTESPGGRWGRRLLVSLLFAAVGYGTIAATERIYDEFKPYPERVRNLLFDKTWYFTDAPETADLPTPYSAFRVLTGAKVEGPFFGAPRIPKACYYAGVLAMLSVLAVNTFLARRQRTRQAALQRTTPSDVTPARRLFRLQASLLGLTVHGGIRADRPLLQVVHGGLNWLACIATACFLVIVHSAAMAGLPYMPSGNTWFLAGSIGAVGLIAFNLALPARPWLRLAAVVVTGAVLAGIVLAAPANEAFGLRATAIRARYLPLAKLTAGLTVAGFLAAFLTAAPSAIAGVGSNPRRIVARYLGPAAMLVTGAVYFLLANVLVSSSVCVREVVSVDRRTGSVQWTARCEAAEISREMHAANTMATPSPVTDGQHVYAHFGEAGLYCLDLAGNVVWHYDEPAPPGHWGSASSPVLWQDLVIMTYDTDRQSLTVAIDKERGTERWRADRTNKIEPSQLHDSYSTPIIVQRDGNAELVHQTCKLLVGYEPATGKERWSFVHIGEQPIATPVVADDVLIVQGGKYAPYLGAIRVRSTGTDQTAEEVWRGKKNLPDLSSPVVYDGYLYTVTKNGIACCIDTGTGRYRWRRRLKGAFWSSVTAADGKIYFCNASGATTVVAAGPKYKMLSVNKLDEETQASLAISQGGIFLRTRKHLLHIGQE